MHGQVVGIHLLLQSLKALNQGGKLIDFGPCTAQVVGGDVADDLPKGLVVLVSQHKELVQTGLADAAGGVVDHALEGFLIVGVHHQPQVADHVFDLLALVETQPAIHPVGDVLPAQGFLEGARLGVGAVENGEIAVVELQAQLLLLDFGGHKTPLVVVAHIADEPDALALLVAGPQILLKLVDVLGNHAGGGCDDGFGAAVVLLEVKGIQLGIVLLEIQDVLDVGTAESVDALCIVTHHAHIAVGSAEHLDDFILREIGVLVLIDQDIPEAMLVFVEDLGVALQQFVGLEKQIIEIHGTRLETTQGVGFVEAVHIAAAVRQVFADQVAVVFVFLRTQQVVFSTGDAVVDDVGLVQIGIELQLLDQSFDQALAVVGIVDGEVAGVTDLGCFHPEDLGEDAVEGSHPNVARICTHYLLNPRPHFLGGLVGKSEGEDVEGVDALVHQMRNAVRKHPGFARSCTCYDHHRPFCTLHSCTLFLVQQVQIVHRSKLRVAGQSRPSAPPIFENDCPHFAKFF